MGCTLRRALTAPAKLNLGLRVVGRRADGYHELESLFVPVGLADQVEVELEEAPAPEVRLRLGPGDAPGAGSVPAGPENLAARAAQRLLEELGARARVSVRLCKRVPAGAGLGGGSSDAAAVLRALAELLPEGGLAPAPEPRRLAELALGLGADVPFFLDPRPAFVEGVGERITPLPGWPWLGALLVHPGPPLSTGEVFRAFAAAGAALTPRRADSTIPRLRGLRGAPPAELLEALGAGGALHDVLHNDLASAAAGLLPAVAELREEVEAAGAQAAGMSGSGPVVFGLFADRQSAGEAARRLRRRPGRRTWVVDTLPSPEPWPPEG